MTAEAAAPAVSGARRNLTLGLLAMVAALSYIDRQAFSIFMPAIGRDLGIDHQQLGFVAGLSFSVFYLLAAFPIARLADRGDRPLIVSLCVAVWSAATAATALAGSMVQLVLLRIGLAAGEGGAGPASQSLLLDLFPPSRRTLVISTLAASSAFGIGAGGAIGGWLSQWLDWRQSMIAVGLPGLLIALAVWFLAVEPRRDASRTFQPPPQMPMREVMGMIVRSASLRWTALAIVFNSVAGFPFVIWSGSFFQIVHGMTAQEAGAALFLPISGGLVVGNLLAGWLGDRFGRGRPRYYALLAAVGMLVAFPLGIATAQAAGTRASLALFFIYHVFVTLYLAPMQALGFAQMPSAMRATLSACFTMLISLCGLGIGTWLVGALSTYFSARYGDLSLRYALTAVCFALPIGAACSIMAGRRAKPLEEAG